MRGHLVALEGIDGCGKSTQARLLADRLGAVLTREPGATDLGASLRRLLLDRDGPAVADRAEALLMAADRAQHVADVVGPALGAGRWVVTDRFTGSTLAYQGHGRGLPVGELERLCRFATGGLVADLTVWIDLPVDEAHRRRRGVGGADDRLEAEGAAFLTRVADGFRALADVGGDAWAVVDGRGPVAEVADAVWAAVDARFPGGSPGGR